MGPTSEVPGSIQKMKERKLKEKRIPCYQPSLLRLTTLFSLCHKSPRAKQDVKQRNNYRDTLGKSLRKKGEMFFFFAGGLEQQVRQVLKSGVGRCINCASPADLVEYEKVLKLFFIPVWRWPGNEPAMYCNNCKFLFPQSYSLPPPSNTDTSFRQSSAVPDVLRCRFCDRVVDADFRFCPYCGSSL